MQVKVTKIGKARSGKPLAYFDNKHGQTDCYLVSDKCNVPVEGMTIDAETKSWDYKGTTYWGLNSWKLLEASPQSQGFAPPQDRGNGQSAPLAPAAQPQKGWDIQSGDLSRYASNIVASAITAGLIKEPSQVVAWAAAAYTSGNSLREGLFPRKFPTEMAGFDPNEDQDRDPDGDLNDDLASSWSQTTADRVRDVPF